MCKISNAVIRYAYIGITATNASPDIQKTAFSNIYYDAVSASGSSNPTINFCDFYTATNFGVNNVNQSFIINAENNWWGKNTGPTHATNPTGTGLKVTNAVDYLPFRTTGPNVPLAGDVSQNGLVQAFDASQILQFLVSSISLTSTQQSVGDVSGNNSLSAMDASYILQYSVGLINNFLSEAYYRPVEITKGELSIAAREGFRDSTIIVPVSLMNANKVLGSFAGISFDSTFLQLDKISFENTGVASAYNSPVAGTVFISMAGTTPINGDATLAYLHLKIKKNAPAGLKIPLVVKLYQGNETDLTASAKNGSVTVLGKLNASNNSLENAVHISPNPAENVLNILIENSNLTNPFTIGITNAAGQKIIRQFNPLITGSGDAVNIKMNTSKLLPGIYFITIQSDSKVITSKFIIAR